MPPRRRKRKGWLAKALEGFDPGLLAKVILALLGAIGAGGMVYTTQQVSAVEQKQSQGDDSLWFDVQSIQFQLGEIVTLRERVAALEAQAERGAAPKPAAASRRTLVRGKQPVKQTLFRSLFGWAMKKG